MEVGLVDARSKPEIITTDVGQSLAIFNLSDQIQHSFGRHFDHSTECSISHRLGPVRHSSESWNCRGTKQRPKYPYYGAIKRRPTRPRNSIVRLATIRHVVGHWFRGSTGRGWSAWFRPHHGLTENNQAECGDSTAVGERYDR